MLQRLMQTILVWLQRTPSRRTQFVRATDPYTFTQVMLTHPNNTINAEVERSLLNT